MRGGSHGRSPAQLLRPAQGTRNQEAWQRQSRNDTAVERILTDTDTRHDPLPHHRAWCVRSGLLKRVHADSAQRRRPNYATCQTVLRFQSLLLYAGVIFINGVLARERRRHEQRETHAMRRDDVEMMVEREQGAARTTRASHLVLVPPLHLGAKTHCSLSPSLTAS